MKEISAEELHQLITSKANFQLIDVREDYEFEETNINGDLIPMGEVMENVDKISKDKQVVIHCRSGKRSATVINALESEHGFTNLYNLKGGILAYNELYNH
ncbi:MAG: rhodanese-like domain-containing protein [Bacteroidota bacterium]|jgi:rhodanese-related sulfurtransferase